MSTKIAAAMISLLCLVHVYSSIVYNKRYFSDNISEVPFSSKYFFLEHCIFSSILYSFGHIDTHNSAIHWQYIDDTLLVTIASHRIDIIGRENLAYPDPQNV